MIFGDWNSTTYIISQVLITIGFVFFGFSYFSKKRDKQLSNVITTNGFFFASYVLQSAGIAAAVSAIGMLRDSVSAIINKYRRNKEKNTALDYFLLSLWIILPSIAMIFTYQGPHSLLAYIATVIFVISIWQKNIFVYRLLGIPNVALWIVYQISIANFMGFVFHSSMFVVIVIGFVKYLCDAKKKA